MSIFTTDLAVALQQVPLWIKDTDFLARSIRAPLGVDMKEIWVAIKGYETRYFVSNHGRVKTTNYRRTGKQKIMANSECMGYEKTFLYSGEKPFSRKKKFIHELVLENFIGPRPKGFYACHYDGNRKNNRLDNLRWDSPSGNAKDNIHNGTILVGEKNHSAKITEKQVIQIFELINKKTNSYDIAEAFGINHGTVVAISKGQRWRHLFHLRKVGQYSTRRTNNQNYKKPLIVLPFR